LKTTLEIPDAVLAEAMRHTNASTESEGVLRALEEYNRKRRLEKLADRMGQSDTFMSLDELLRMREGEMRRDA